jgi:hypothetical protein
MSVSQAHKHTTTRDRNVPDTIRHDMFLEMRDNASSKVRNSINKCRVLEAMRLLDSLTPRGAIKPDAFKILEPRVGQIR